MGKFKFLRSFILPVILLALASGNLLAQNDTTGLIRYSPEFRFRDGIFLTFDQVKTNSPLPFSRIDLPVSSDDPDFISRLLDEKLLIFYDQFGMKSQIQTSAIWGYAHMGALFVRYENEFERIPVFGRISHFVATVIVRNQLNQDPFYRNQYSYDPMGNNSYSTREMEQFLLDFNTGKVFPYNAESLKVLLMADQVLFDEFNALTKRKQRKMMFFYLRKFNERNPVFFPQK